MEHGNLCSLQREKTRLTRPPMEPARFQRDDTWRCSCSRTIQEMGACPVCGISFSAFLVDGLEAGGHRCYKYIFNTSIPRQAQVLRGQPILSCPSPGSCNWTTIQGRMGGIFPWSTLLAPSKKVLLSALHALPSMEKDCASHAAQTR